MVTKTKWFAKQLELDAVNTPDSSVKPSNENPDSRVNVEVVVKNHALMISSFDPDLCHGPSEAGYEATLYVTDESSETTRVHKQCFEMGFIPPGVTRVNVDFPAPINEGSTADTHSVSAYLQLEGSGEESAKRYNDYQVAPADGSGEVDPEPGDGGDDGDDGDNGDGGDDGGDGDKSPMEVLTAFLEDLPFVVTIVAIAVIAKAIGDILGD